MKKLSVMLVLVLFVTSLLSFTALAEDKLLFKAENVKTKAGETVEVPIKLSNNKGVWGIAINVLFDKNVFSVAQVKNNNDIFVNGEFTIGPDDFSKGYVRVCAFSNNINANNTKNGTLCTIVFDVKSNAVPGKYPIKFEYDEKSACDVDSNYVLLSSENGTIEILNESEQKPVVNTQSNGEVLINVENNKQVTVNANTTKNNSKTNSANKANSANKTNSTKTNSADKTNKNTQLKTYKNGQTVTDKNGQAVTENNTEAVSKSDSSNSIKSEDFTENNADANISEKSDKASNASSSGLATTYIILGSIVLAGVVLAIVVYKLKKNKKKK